MDFEPPLDTEQRARRCIRVQGLRIVDESINALIELLNALKVKFKQNTRSGVGLILQGVADPSKLGPRLAIVRWNGAYKDLELAVLIFAKFVCDSLIAPSSLVAMVMGRKKLKIAARVRQIRI